VGWKPPDVELTDDQLSDVMDDFKDTDDELLRDSVTPTPNTPMSTVATGRLSTAAQNPPKQTLPEAPTRWSSAFSSPSPSVDNPLSTPASGPVSSQQWENFSKRALMPVTLHSSPQSSQQNRAAADIDSEPGEAKKSK